jgi:8-oxo-dGTP diphosphatase
MRTRIAAIIIENGKLLMEKGKGYNELWTPGGKQEEGESDEECLRRELEEELKVNIIEMKFFKEYEGVSYYNKDKKIKQRIYIVSINGDIKPSMEIENVVWLTKDDLKNHTFSLIPTTEKEIIPDLIKKGLF